MIIKIFSDKQFLPPRSECQMLLPFWGQGVKEIGDPDVDRFDKYVAEGHGIFQMTTLEEADIVVYPASPTYNLKQFKDFQTLTGSKPLVVFFHDDSDTMLSGYRDNTFIFRTSFYKSTQLFTEFALPGFCADSGTFPERLWSSIPTISFCGQMCSPNIRKEALGILEDDSRIAKQVIIRDKFWGGWIASGRRADIGRQVRQEFLQNISDGDYVLCVRGGGNFSFRLYETMMCGRIPLLVNTDCVLPYDFLIDWKKLFPIVDQFEIQHIGDLLLDFHNSFSPEQFIERQKIMRTLWEQWISPVGFFSNFNKHFILG